MSKKRQSKKKPTVESNGKKNSGDQKKMKKNTSMENITKAKAKAEDHIFRKMSYEGKNING